MVRREIPHPTCAHRAGVVYTVCLPNRVYRKDDRTPCASSYRCSSLSKSAECKLIHEDPVMQGNYASIVIMISTDQIQPINLYATA